MELASRRHPRKHPPDDASGAGPDPLDALQVVERGPAGGGFVGAEIIDSYAMEDPPSEEVRLDPRFHRIAEPATELIDRESMRAMAEELLAGPPPHPDEVTHSVAFEIPSHGAAPSPLGLGAVPSISTSMPRDPATERIDRSALQDLARSGGAHPVDLVEVTVPTPVADLELVGSGTPDLTMPAPVGFDRGEPARQPRAPDDVSVDEIDPGAPPAPPPAPVAAPTPSRSVPPATRTSNPPRRTPAPAPRAERRHPALVGMVALVSSGGVLAAGAAAGLLALVVGLFVFSHPAEDPPTLPPIEVAPVEHPVDAVPAEPVPDPEVEPEPPPSQVRPRPRPKPAPVVAPAPPPPEPVAPAPPPKPIQDLEPTEPEGGKKKNKKKK